MLGTNIVSDLMRNPAGTVAVKIAEVGQETICLSIITAAELRFGAAKSRSPVLLSRVEAVLAHVPVLPFDSPADLDYGDIRWSLEASGRPIGPNDLLIAAHARRVGATIVTANTNEFDRVPGLDVENWIA